MKIFNITLLAVISCLFFSCSGQSKLSQENRKLKIDNKRLDTEFTYQSQKAEKYIDSFNQEKVRANNAEIEVERLTDLHESGLTTIRIEMIDSNLKFHSLAHAQEGLEYLREGDQVRSARYAFFNMLKGPNEEWYANSKNNKSWESIKEDFKRNPKKYQRWFNISKPFLKAFKSFSRTNITVNDKTKRYYNLNLPDGMTTKFKQIYNSCEKGSLDYRYKCKKAWENKEFDRFGNQYQYDPEESYENSKLREDFLYWVWAHEYGPDAVRVMKNVCEEISTWGHQGCIRHKDTPSCTRKVFFLLKIL